MTAEEKSRWWMQQMALWTIASTLALILAASISLGSGFTLIACALAAVDAFMVVVSALLAAGFAREEGREQ